jgi:hypothetical protein
VQEVIEPLDLARLTKGERILGISALVLSVLSFLPLWAKLEYDTGGAEIPGFDDDQGFSAWSELFGFLLKLALVLTIIALVIVIVRAVGTNLNLPVPAWQIYLGTTVLALLLFLITVLTGPKGDQGDFGVFEYSRGIALFLAPVLAAAMAYGAYLHMQQEGGSPRDMTSGLSGGPSNTPPPPAS